MVRSEMSEQVTPLISSGISHCVPARTLIFDPKDHCEGLLLLPSEIERFSPASFNTMSMPFCFINCAHNIGVDRRAKWHNLEV